MAPLEVIPKVDPINKVPPPLNVKFPCVFAIVAWTIKVPQFKEALLATESDPVLFITKLLSNCKVLVEEPVPITKVIGLVLIPPAVEVKVWLPDALLKVTVLVPPVTVFFKAAVPLTKKLPPIFSATAPELAVLESISITPVDVILTFPATFTVQALLPALPPPTNARIPVATERFPPILRVNAVFVVAGVNLNSLVPKVVMVKLPAVKFTVPVKLWDQVAPGFQLSSKLPNGNVTPVVRIVAALVQLSILTLEVAPKTSVPANIVVEAVPVLLWIYVAPFSIVKVSPTIAAAVEVVVEPDFIVTSLKDVAVVIDCVVPLKFTILVDFVKVPVALKLQFPSILIIPAPEKIIWEFIFAVEVSNPVKLTVPVEIVKIDFFVLPPVLVPLIVSDPPMSNVLLPTVICAIVLLLLGPSISTFPPTARFAFNVSVLLPPVDSRVNELAADATLTVITCPLLIITISLESGIPSVSSVPVCVQLPDAFQLPVAAFEEKVVWATVTEPIIKKAKTIKALNLFSKNCKNVFIIFIL